MKKIRIKSSCNYTLKAYSLYLESILKSLSLKYSIFYLPKEEQKLTLLKSPHVYKKAKEQFKIETYKVIISIKDLENNNNLNKLVPFLINKPKAIFIKINPIPIPAPASPNVDRPAPIFCAACSNIVILFYFF